MAERQAIIGGKLMRTAMAAAAAALAALQAVSAQAVELNVTHFGTGMYGVPHAVAKEKGYFKEAGLDVTGFLTSAGGGTTVRHVLASELPDGEGAGPAGGGRAPHGAGAGGGARARAA